MLRCVFCSGIWNTESEIHPQAPERGWWRTFLLLRTARNRGDGIVTFVFVIITYFCFQFNMNIYIYIYVLYIYIYIYI